MMYVALLVGSVAIAGQDHPPALVRVGLVIVVSLPVIGMIASMGQLKEEQDEYLPVQIVQQWLIATVFC